MRPSRIPGRRARGDWPSMRCRCSPSTP